MITLTAIKKLLRVGRNWINAACQKPTDFAANNIQIRNLSKMTTHSLALELAATLRKMGVQEAEIKLVCDIVAEILKATEYREIKGKH